MKTLQENKFNLKELLLQLKQKQNYDHFVQCHFDELYDTIENIFNQQQEIDHKDTILDEGDFILDFKDIGDSRKDLVFQTALIIMDVLK